MPQVSIPELVAAARAGQLVGFPTDTVPAIASITEAAARIYTAKQRETAKPLILMAATAEALWPFIQGDAVAQAEWETMAAQYWPGALTLVLPKGDRVPKAVNPENPIAIGIRVPACPLALEILAQTGPLATTSLNVSGQPPLEDLEEIGRVFPSVFTPTPALWQLPSQQERLPSTVAQWDDGDWIVLRQGAVRLSP